MLNVKQSTLAMPIADAQRVPINYCSTNKNLSAVFDTITLYHAINLRHAYNRIFFSIVTNKGPFVLSAFGTNIDYIDSSLIDRSLIYIPINLYKDRYR